jgi:hypothetical protein
MLDLSRPWESLDRIHIEGLDGRLVKQRWVWGRGLGDTRRQASELILGPARNTVTNTERQIPEVVLIQFVSPDDEHNVLETCTELK